MKTGPAHTARINGQPISVESGETLLAAALRAGIAFPNSCRVGGCATCKCRLTSGSVREATETAYLLSDDEVAQRFILACQSSPTTDVAVEVDLAKSAVRVSGRLVGREALTHDIARLTIRLDAPLDYLPGQFASLSIEGLPEVHRTYSFAAPPTDDGTCTFIVRRVEGGAMSPLLTEGDVVGRSVTVEGPSGDCWLRPGDAPLLFAAGGSGLAPILAMLEAAATAGDRRPVTLLFGARTEQDLFALDELRSIAARWQGPFTLLPVLSHEPPDSGWGGARGWLTDHLVGHATPRTEAYLCGPPAMVDSLVSALRAAGLTQDQIRFDRFTSAADVAVANPAPAPAPAPLAVLHYLKFFLFHIIGALAFFALLLGGSWVSIGLVSVLTIYLLGDAVAGDDTSVPEYRYPGVLTLQLWLALPLLALFVFASVWSVSPGDPLGFGALLTPRMGFDLLAAKAATPPIHHFSAFVLTGLIIGMVGTITAHELTHRTWDRVSMFVGRWLLAFSFDTIFSIEHVYGHHRYVSTKDDPATAPRGRDVYAHVAISTWRGNVSAWHIETARLRRLGLSVWSWRNAFLRGHLMSLLLVAGAFAMGGLSAALYFSACALWGKSLLEIVNYMEHYGMVRDPATPVQPRHSWNTNRRISSWSMFNLTRHSHHHAQGEVPFQDLRPIPNAPMMMAGYLTTIVVALIPPLWHAIMTPKVLAWDRDFASPRERELAAAANARSRRFRAASRA